MNEILLRIDAIDDVKDELIFALTNTGTTVSRGQYGCHEAVNTGDPIASNFGGTVRQEDSLASEWEITFSSISCTISSFEIPSSSPNTYSLCSPSRGAPRRIRPGVRLIFQAGPAIGLFSINGSGSSTKNARFLRCGSFTMSAPFKVGVDATPTFCRISMTS